MSAPHVRIDRSVLADTNLSLAAKLVFALLSDHWNEKTEQCNPKRKTLAHELGIDSGKHQGMRTIARALKELREAGFIQSDRQRYTNCYQIQIGQKRPPDGDKSAHLDGTKAPMCPSGPLYEPTQGNLRARAKRDGAFPPRKKPAHERILERYYELYGKEA